MKGFVSNIQRFSTDDGPGIRTTVFLKGCNLRCPWCHNPETQRMESVLQFTKTSCIYCGACAAACPNRVHEITAQRHLLHRENCNGCGACAEACPAGALSMNGKAWDADSLMEVLRKDRYFYEDSDGGITFSGGEPMLQPAFLLEMLKRCREDGFSTAVDTAGAVSWDTFREILPFADIFLYDLKIMDPEAHARVIGQDNGLILDNYRRLMAAGKRIFVRMPVIRGVNDTMANIGATGIFLKEAGIPEKVELLPYHNYGLGKYESLGMHCEVQDRRPPEPEWMEAAAGHLREMNIPAQVS